VGNEATMKILHFLVVNTLPHLAHAIKFPRFKVLQFAYNVCGWQVPKHNCVEIRQIVEKAFKVPIENIFHDFE
jgi:hypothetical protein